MTADNVKPGPKANNRGLFAGDWASNDKISMLTETSTIFSSLQKIVEHDQERMGSTNPIQSITPLHTLQYFHRISNLYREKLRIYMEKLEASENEVDDEDLELTQSIHTILHFAETIYLPVDGRGTGVVGEEILHWLNSFDFQPRTEEGQEIAQRAAPYEREDYWQYIMKCITRGFLSSATSLLSYLTNGHRSPKLREISKRVGELISSMPRSISFKLEHDFIAAHRRWKDQVKSISRRLEMDMNEVHAELDKGVYDKDKLNANDDERITYEARLNCLLGLIIGEKERVNEVCHNWRELLAAWGVLIQPGMKRDDIPAVMKTVLSVFPVRSNVPDKSKEDILTSLAVGNALDACKQARDYDPWLAAHMSDILDRIGLLEEEEEMEEDLDNTSSQAKGQSSEEKSVRTEMLEEYAETVLDDQCLWRLALCYLSYCGPKARHRMRNIILDVSLSGTEVLAANRIAMKRPEDLMTEAEEAEIDEEEDDPDRAMEARRAKKEALNEAKRVSEEYSCVMEVIETCIELDMPIEARAICKHMASEMVRKGRMGAALAYCVRARDDRQMKRIADVIFETYIDQGCQAFCSIVDSIPVSLLDRASRQAEQDAVKGTEGIMIHTSNAEGIDRIVDNEENFMHSSRLVFLSRYRDFHRIYAQGDLRSAATSLVEILTSNIAPEPYRAVLLVDTIPLLQSGQDIFSTEENYELLRLLDEILTASTSHPLQAKYYLSSLERILTPQQKSISNSVEERSMGLDDDESDTGGKHEAYIDQRAAIRRLDILRLALARHLARSVVV